MAGENVWPKADDDTWYGTDANYGSGIVAVNAGENVTAGNVVYIHLTDGKAYVSDTGAANDIRASGICLTTATSGNPTDVMLRGVYKTSGLTANEDYYLGAAGAVSTTASGVRVGHALSTTLLAVNIRQDDRDAVGIIKPYAKSFTGVPSNNMTAFWKECDGSVLSDAESPLNGQTLPDLNTTKRFLRGSGTSGTTGGADTHSHGTGSTQDLHNTPGHGAGDEVAPGSTGSASTLPAHYEVVFIIKIK